MDVLLGKAMNAIEVEFQRAYNVAVVIDRYGQ